MMEDGDDGFDVVGEDVDAAAGNEAAGIVAVVAH